MPLYAYRCKDCNHEFEVRQRFSDDPLVECPNCKGAIRRVISNVGIVFKGSGFYVTDNAGSKGSLINGGSATAGDESKANGKEESKTDKKIEKSADGATSKPAGPSQSSSPTTTAGAAT